MARLDKGGNLDRGCILKLMKIMHVMKKLRGFRTELEIRKQIKGRVDMLYVFSNIIEMERPIVPI